MTVSITRYFHALYVLKQFPNIVPRVFRLVDMWKYATKQNKYLFISKSGKPLETRLHIICASNPRCGDKFKISELITSFPTPSPGSLAFTILLMTTRIFFIIITVGKVRDPGTLSYLTDNSSFQTKIKNMDLLRDKDRRFSS